MIAIEFEMEQPNRLAVRQNRNAAIVARYRSANMGAREIDFVRTIGVWSATPQAPAIIRVHCRHHLPAIPGFRAFQNIPRVGIDVQAPSTSGKQPAEKLS